MNAQYQSAKARVRAPSPMDPARAWLGSRRGGATSQTAIRHPGLVIRHFPNPFTHDNVEEPKIFYEPIQMRPLSGIAMICLHH
jgi:hypothetical protein